MNFTRIGDHLYFFVENKRGSENDIFVNCQNSGLSAADERYLCLWLASQKENKLLGSSPVVLSYNDKLIKLTSAKRSLSYQIGKIVAAATNLFRTHGVNRATYELEAVREIDRTQLAAMKRYEVEGSPRATVAMTDNAATSPLLQPPYSDPYTLLAEKAFQQGLELEFYAHDTQRASDTCFYFDPKSNELTLVARGELGKVKKKLPTAVRDAINRYRAFLVSEYGQKRVAYLENLNGINLHEMAVKNEPLTPEIVYRMNVGTSLVEIQDLQELWKSLQAIAEKEPSEPLLKAMEKELPLFEQRSLVRELKKDAAALTVADLKGWIKTVKESGREMDRLMDLYVIDQVDRDRMYTGRKIFETIASDYTTADYGKRKVWVDLQELAQIAEEHEYDEARKIPETQKEAAFYERLAHVVCKKELVHSHPVDGVRVGMLIPARPHKDGSRQWYVVTGCTKTPYGKCSYRLEPASPQSGLPRILLHRSTFSTTDPSSTRSDLNPISAPGYEGYELAAGYEDDFIDHCTIPVWVGYTLMAEKGENKIEQLTKATEALIHELKKPYKPLSFLQLMRKHDYLLLKLFFDAVNGDKVGLLEANQLYNILSDCSKKSDFSSDEEKKNSQFIASLLERYPSKENLAFAEKLRDESAPADAEAIVSKLSIVKELRDFQAEAEGAEEKWLQRLLEHARLLGEHPSQKTTDNIAIVGHSLGGSLGQLSMVRYSEAKERIPLSQMKLWMFDSPAIHKEDAEAFLAFGQKHTELLAALGGGKFAISSSQEAGDLFVLFGERHLGSVSSVEELEMLKKWLDFEAFLYESQESVTTRALRDSSSVHATRFQTRKADSDVTFKKISPFELYQFGSELNPELWKRLSAVWKILPRTPLADLSPQKAEQIRKRLGLLLRAFNPLFLSDSPEKGLFEKHADANGLFAINLSGLQSHSH